MYAWIQRKKKQAWGIALASAAGIAVAYYAYSWYTTPGNAEEVGNSDQVDGAAGTPHSEVHTGVSRNLPGDARSSAAGSLELEARIREQQTLLQSIANKQTLPEAHQRLHRRLLEYSGVDKLTAALRALRPSAPPATSSGPSAFPATSAEHAERMARKLAMWAELRDQSFVLLAATTWLLPALSLLVHIQLTIIGRSAYLEHLAHTPYSPTSTSHQARMHRKFGSPALTGVAMKRLSSAEQEAYLSYGSFLLQHGLDFVMPALQDAVKAQVSDLALQEHISLSSLWQILSQIHEDVDYTVHTEAWRAALLPPLVPGSTPRGGRSMQAFNGRANGDNPLSPQDLHHTGAQQASSSAAHMQPVDWAIASEFQPTGLDEESAQVVAKLILETREILSSEFFLCAFHTSVKWCAAATAEALQEHFDSAQRPPGSSPGQADKLQGGSGDAHESEGDLLQDGSASMVTAAMLPRLAKIVDELLTTGSDLSEEMCRLPAVRALLDATFASGPFLDIQAVAR